MNEHSATATRASPESVAELIGAARGMRIERVGCELVFVASNGRVIARATIRGDRVFLTPAARWAISLMRAGQDAAEA